jgi:hypothetical protein
MPHPAMATGQPNDLELVPGRGPIEATITHSTETHTEPSR